LLILQYYTREGCHLCEEMLEELIPLIRGKAGLKICNVDLQENWKKKYGIRVPIIKSGKQTISEYPLNYKSLQIYLKKTLESQ